MVEEWDWQARVQDWTSKAYGRIFAEEGSHRTEHVIEISLQ